MLSGLITLHLGLVVQAIRSWVVCLKKELAQWKKGTERMRVVGVFSKDICTVSAWFCARTGSLTIGFEWGGLAVCQTLRTGCFIFKVTKFGVTFLFCFWRSC